MSGLEQLLLALKYRVLSVNFYHMLEETSKTRLKLSKEDMKITAKQQKE